MAEYTMKGLRSKYKEFTAPTAQVILGEKTIASYGWGIVSVESSTGVQNEAGMCTVTLAGVYDVKNSKFLCEEALVRGTPVEVRLGYIVTKTVFKGFLYEVEYEMDTEHEPKVVLICMDVKAAMMGSGIFDFSGSMTYKQVIQSFFTGKNARGYSVLCKTPTMNLPELNQPVSRLPDTMDDYSFLTQTASRFGLECFVCSGDLLLRKKPPSPAVLLELTPAEGIEQLSVRLRSVGYVKSVSVLGGSDDERDSDKKGAHGTADNSYKIAAESSNAGRLLGGRKLELFSASVRDDNTAKMLAEGVLRQRQTMCSELQLTMVGLPELLPGFALNLARVSPKLNGNWYIVSVFHKMDDTSFRTTLQARRAL